jgi:hypothetical protein
MRAISVVASGVLNAPEPVIPLSVTITFPADEQFDGGSVPWDTPSVGVPGTVSVVGGVEPYNYLWTFVATGGIDSITDDTLEICTIETALFGGGNPNVVTLTVTDSAGSPAVEFDSANVNVQAS